MPRQAGLVFTLMLAQGGQALFALRAGGSFGVLMLSEQGLGFKGMLLYTMGHGPQTLLRFRRGAKTPGGILFTLLTQFLWYNSRKRLLYGDFSGRPTAMAD